MAGIGDGDEGGAAVSSEQSPGGRSRREPMPGDSREPPAAAPLSAAEQAARPAPAEIPAGRFDAFVFDMDGVVTDTATVHAGAWRQLFDDYLGRVAARGGPAFRPFTDDDYRRFVDGRARSTAWPPEVTAGSA